jgi:hypothetical protein
MISIQVVQHTAAAILVSGNSLSLSAAAAAELWRSATQKGMVMNGAASRLVRPVALGVMLFAGCSSRSNNPPDIIAEGILYSVEYRLEGGGTGGFTRTHHMQLVPGGNGSPNVDAYGKLTRDFLLITRQPQSPDFGPEVIPVHRLIRVQFGDGGIKQVQKD